MSKSQTTEAPKVNSLRFVYMLDDAPDVSYLEGSEDRRDKQRLQAFRRGDWFMVGVRADAEIVIQGVTQHLTSGGLWGIESDSSEKYLKTVEKEQYDELVGILKQVGVRTIPSRSKATTVRKF